MVTEMTNLRGVLTADFRTLGSELRGEMAGMRENLESLEVRVQRGNEKQSVKSAQIGSVLRSLTGVLQLLAGGVFETRLRLPEDGGSDMDVRSTSGYAGGESTMHQAFATLDQHHGDKRMEQPNDADTARPGSDGPPPVASSSSLDALAPLLRAAETEAQSFGRETSDEEVGRQLAPTTRLVHAVSMPTSFILESNHTTVLELWTEWYTGVSNRPSIIAMIDQQLPKSEGQRKLFARRKIIIDEIKRLAKEKTVPESEIVGRIDVYRVKNKLSITKLQDEIKRKRAQGEAVI